MTNNFFEVLRTGINSTFQDIGRENYCHIGLPLGGAMDRRNYLIANKLVDNNKNCPVLEFAYQGPLLKLNAKKTIFCISGDVIFKIIKNNGTSINGQCYKTYIIEQYDQIDIISTNKSVYGYLSVAGGFKLKKFLNSYSTLTRAEIGANNGKKLQLNQKIELEDISSLSINKEVNYVNSKIEFIRILKGTNFNFFSEKSINEFFTQEFLITKLTDRMGMRLMGPSIVNLQNTNIKSEGIIRGTIQIPADGNPIVMLSDHGTLGGYPKLGVVISADYDKLIQLPSNTKIKFKLTDLKEAEKMYTLYEMETNNILNQI